MTPQQRLFSAEQVVVHSTMPALLLDYSKEVIRANPANLVLFSKNYFKQRLLDAGTFDQPSALEVKVSDLLFRKGQKFHQHYQLGPVIGDPTVSMARVATQTKTGKQVAVKLYDKSTIPDFASYLQKAEEMQRKLDHPHLMKYEEIYEDKDYVYFVMDYARGGELYDAIEAKGNFTEHDCAHIIHQLLLGINYLHDQCGTAHRNIRPGNVLFMS